MSQYGTIRHLRREEIDQTKWDHCIDRGHTLLYAFSFYLDIMAKHWDALVLNDYEAIMPLPWNKKYGIKYIYQPFLTPQLGMFGPNIQDKEELCNQFLENIPASFKYVDQSLNGYNIFKSPPTFLTPRSNYVLLLNESYERLYEKYNENLKRNIKKAYHAGCTIQKSFDVEDVIALAVAQMKRYGNESKENIDRFRKLYAYLEPQKMAMTYGVFSAENKLVASCVFFNYVDRAYYILVGNDPTGRNIGASHALIDAFIKDHAGNPIPMFLDFEGSDFPSLAAFYSSFGAFNDVYYQAKMNRLPFYLKWLKK